MFACHFSHTPPSSSDLGRSSHNGENVHRTATVNACSSSSRNFQRRSVGGRQLSWQSSRQRSDYERRVSNFEGGGNAYGPTNRPVSTSNWDSELNLKIMKVANVVRDALDSGTLDQQATKDLIQQTIRIYHKFLEDEPVLPIHLSTILHRVAIIGTRTGLSRWIVVENWPFLGSIMRKIHKEMLEFSPRNLSTVVWALGKFGPRIQEGEFGGGLTSMDLLDEITMVASDELCNFNAQDIATLLVGFANLDYRNCERLMDPLYVEIESKQYQFKCQEVASVAWAIAKLGLEKGRDTVESFDGWIVANMAKFSAHSLSNILWAAAVLRVRFSLRCIREMGLGLLERRRMLGPQDYSNSLWALAKLKFSPGESYLDSFVYALPPKIVRFKPQEVANLLYAFAIFDYAPDSVLDIAKAYILDFRDEFKLQEMCNCAWSLAILGNLDSDIYSATVDALIKENGGGVNAGSNPNMWLNPSISDLDLRQLHQSTIGLTLLNSSMREIDIPKALRDICERTWIAFHLMSPINYIASHVIERLGDIGYECESPAFVPEAGITVNAVRVGACKVAVEVVGPLGCFRNDKFHIEGPEKWRHNVLRALGWEVVVIYEDVWTEMDENEQAWFLEDNVLVFEK